MFITDILSLVEPLKWLLKKTTPWEWEQAFPALKCYYDLRCRSWQPDRIRFIRKLCPVLGSQSFSDYTSTKVLWPTRSCWIDLAKHRFIKVTRSKKHRIHVQYLKHSHNEEINNPNFKRRWNTEAVISSKMNRKITRPVAPGKIKFYLRNTEAAHLSKPSLKYRLWDVPRCRLK